MSNRAKILLADESVTLHRVAELAFNDAGLDVVFAVDGQTAMETFVREQPNLVLVDIGLSGTNGYRICEMIKNDDSTRDIPVLLMVGAFEPFDHTEAERVGADGFLMKPFNPIKDVISRIRELLDGRSNTMMMSHELLAKESTNDIEALYSSSYTETTRVEEVFIGDVYREVEASSDDELIETLAPDATEDPFGYTMPDVKMDQDDVDEFDGSSPTITPSDDDLGSSLETTPRHFSDHTEAAQPPIEPSADPAAHEAPISSAKKEQAFFANEISEEVIDRIVDRVMEKLSDSVVREVAMREVPRIAEKLMREALDQEERN
jgi:CheY-like chemotaxis protein